MERHKEGPPEHTDGPVSVPSPKTSRCLHCGASIDNDGCYWRRFCSDRCRALFGSEARRVGMRVLVPIREQEFADGTFDARKRNRAS